MNSHTAYTYLHMEELADELKLIATKCHRLARSRLSEGLINSRKCLHKVGDEAEELGEALRSGRVPL